MRRRMRGMALAASVAAVLAGCASSPSTGAGEELQGDWLLVSASDRRGAMDLQDAIVTLSIEEQSASGDGPCNRVALEVDGGPGSVAVFVGAITERACADTALMGIEGRYLTVLSNVAFAEVTDYSLVLRGKSGELGFQRA